MNEYKHVSMTHCEYNTHSDYTNSLYFTLLLPLINIFLNHSLSQQSKQYHSTKSKHL